MSYFTTALKAEHIKKKGTAIYWLAVILGAFMPFVYAIVMIIRSISEDDMKGNGGIPYNYFTHIIENMLEGYAGFFYPLLIIITVSRITQLDHKNGGWQLMETQPVSKWALYSSKLSVLLISNLISIVTLITCCFAFGGVILLFADAPKAATFGFEVLPVLEIILRLFLAGLFFTAVQYFISVLIPSFIWSILIGFFMLLGYLFLNIFNVIPVWYPVDIISKVATYKTGSQIGYIVIYTEVLSLVLAAVTVFIGFTWYNNKRFKIAFLSNGKRTAAILGALIAGIGLSWYIVSPNRYEAYNKTVVSGKISGPDKVQHIYVLDNFINDTIAKIPVTDNTFHYKIDKPMPLDTYIFVFSNNINAKLVMSTNDSIYLDVKKYGNSMDATVTGTRLAENQFEEEKAGPFDFSMAQYYLENKSMLDNPDGFLKQLEKEWEDAMDKTSKFKTADNYIPRADFMELRKKTATIVYLTYWQKFVNDRQAAYPDKETKPSAAIAEMKKLVPLNDESLLSDGNYFTYLKAELISKDKEDIDEDTKALKAIAKMDSSSFKDKMLYWQITNSLRAANSAAERDSLISGYANMFTNKRYTAIAYDIDNRLDRIERGALAPEIAATGIDQKPFTLEQYKGKLVAIDVWATWCGPCRQESPKFEKMAIKFKEEDIVFVALSTDKDINDWYLDAKLRGKSVLQTHVNDNELFSKEYDIQFIPRFILIGKDGKVISADMPRPSEGTFEDILRKELGMKEL